jgi:hypothetical protein
MHAATGQHVMESRFVAASRTRLARTETCFARLDDPNGTFVVIPVSFNSLGLVAGPHFCSGHELQCTVHSTETVLIEEVRIPPQLVAHAVVQQVMAKSNPRTPIPAYPDMKIYELDSVFVATNTAKEHHFHIELDVVSAVRFC